MANSFVGLLESGMTGGKSDEVNWSTKHMTDEWENLASLSYEDLRVALEKAVYQGDLTPEQAEAALQQKTAFDEVSADPRLKEAQLKALNQLQNISEEGGLTATDRAKLNQIATEESARERGSREAILQNAQQRGVGGSGLELASQMIASQEATGRQSARDTDVAAQAQQRALEAMLASGELSGNMRNQDFSEQAKIAEARDALARFNAQNQQQVNLYNTNARNQAALRNVNTLQNVSDMNTDIKNKQAFANSQASKDAFSTELARTQGTSSAYGKAADIQNQQGEQAKKTVGTIISAIAASDKNLKEDIEEFDAEDFLDCLTGYKYKYKKPEKHGEGKQVGVMAQDLEKGAPQLVIDTPEGKKVDYSKAGGPLFASLASINKRLKKLEGKE